MQIQTKRFGLQEIDEKKIIFFPEGVIGFKQFKQYVILPEPNFDIFVWLQSVQNPQLAFVLMDPLIIRPEYQVKIMVDDQKQLELSDEQQGNIYAIVTIPQNFKEMTANLLAPIVINREANLGKQVILSSDSFHTRHRILEEMDRLKERSQ